jgi:hypothetical protein
MAIFYLPSLRSRFASGREVVLEPTKDQTFITFVGK